MVSQLPIADEANPRGPAVARMALSAEGAVALSAKFKAIADPTRLRLLSLVAGHEEGEACVGDLTEPIRLSQPTVSHHLKILVEAGLLSRSKRGSWAFYALVPGALDGLADILRTSVDDSVRVAPVQSA